MQLSEHFSLGEMTTSQTAVRRGIDNTPTPVEIANMQELCKHVLEPIRSHFARPVRVSSGYRCPALNRAIHSTSKSQHIRGEAADITVPGVDNLRLAKWVRDNTEFDQVIMEGNWVHVSYAPHRPLRSQCLTAHFSSHGEVTYTVGL